MKRFTVFAAFFAASLLVTAQSAFAAADNACTADEIARGKTTICHHPPGNPENASTICVGSTGANSPAAHIANHPGDSVGACANPCPNGCDDSDPCTIDSCGASGCEHAVKDPCCQSDQDCAAATVCTGAETCDLTTNTCTAGAPTSCDDGNPCTDDPCDPTDGCSVHPDNGTCCCQQFEGPPTGPDEADHCFQGCVGCTGTCVETSVCPAEVPNVGSTCPGFVRSGS